MRVTFLSFFKLIIFVLKKYGVQLLVDERVNFTDVRFFTLFLSSQFLDLELIIGQSNIRCPQKSHICNNYFDKENNNFMSQDVYCS